LPKQQVTPIPDQAVPANQRQEAGVIVEAPAQPTAEISNASEPVPPHKPAIFCRLKATPTLTVPMLNVQKS
jgi:hypothetical protein